MSTKIQSAFALCLAVLAISTVAHASTQRRFTLILDFNTCAGDPNNANILVCQEKDGTGKPVGEIQITFQSLTATDGTCGTNPGCSMSWHEGYLYTLDGGTITVGTARAWQGQTVTTDENGFAPNVGFSVGAVTGATGKYSGTTGTLTMRWDDNLCICLFDVVE